ncbi:hypothetical protein FOZ60_001144 [Perkinsus olseni]|uniref:Phytase-like domain-containing protein n=1 Tax=Perkinsus olseni TaxID=32597 RepID=A0A7J6P0W0_PEROL|nr:hypothetical protein FOZ60_001144 [Perkinsus olseni]
MSTRSVFFAAILSVAACQRDIVSIQQRRLPFQNGTLRDVFTTPAGTLKHIQTLQIQNAVGPRSQFDEISSIIVNSDGSQLLAINDDALFFTIRLEKTFGDQFDVSEAVLYPMRDPDGESIPFEPRDGNPRGLTIDGAYPGEGRGELFVGFGSGRRLLKFPVGVRSLTSAEVDISVLLEECENGPRAINKMRPNRLRPGYLLMICDEPTTSDPNVYPGYAYHGDRPTRFTVESDGDFFPADMAGLSNGDVMILFRTPDNTMRIGLVTARDLSLAMRPGETVVPQIILEAAESDGFNVGRQSGLAIREDSDNRVFVYTTSESRFTGRPTLLTAFEWIA